MPPSFPSIRSFAVIVVLAITSLASAATASSPESLGFSSERLQRLDNVMQDYVDRHQVAGANILIARHGQIVELKSFGAQDIEAGKPMQPETIFRIASMSKVVTTIAALMLYEEGRLLLHDPVSKYLPEFAHSAVAVAPSPGSPADTRFSTVPATHPITILNLLTHTAGLTYGTGPAAAEYKQAGLTTWELMKNDETLAAMITRLAALPLNGQPGENWQYGYGTDVLGRVIEVISGQPLDQFFAERIFAPLQMKDTSFYLPVEKVGRLAAVYGMEKGALKLFEAPSHSAFVEGPRKIFLGGAGLLSTITDYGHLLQMLLNNGEYNGHRLLSPKTVELMHTDILGSRYPGDATVGDPRGYGLGLWIVKEPGAYGELASVGSYGWGSAYNPIYVVDPKEDLYAIIMLQLKPAGTVDLNRKFRVMTYQALEK